MSVQFQREPQMPWPECSPIFRALITLIILALPVAAIVLASTA